MKPIKLDKFPVTAPDGTEYRVTIKEEDDSLFGKYYAARVYVERTNRKFFRFKRIHSCSYNFSGGNFVGIAENAVTEVERRKAEAIAIENAKSAGVEAFRQWNGKITESESGVSE